MAGTVITKKGLQLIAKLVASGTALTFTRASVGTGFIPSGYDPKNMTDLDNYKMEGLISSCSSSADEASIIMQISSMGVETGFTITETGLFATDPDEGEILYAYLDLSKDPQYVYAEDSAISKFVEMTLVVKVGSVERVTAYLNPESLVTRDGDISETVIETLDTVEDKYPIPAAGESVKRFFGKVLTFLKNIRPLTENINIYVSTTGSDILGDGTPGNPFKTIQHAIDIVPKDLNGYNATIIVDVGTYLEDITIKAFRGGSLNLYSANKDTLTNTCIVNSIEVSVCGSAYIRVNGFNLVTTSREAIAVYGCNGAYITYCQSTITSSFVGIQSWESYCNIEHCKISNHNTAALYGNSTGTSADWDSGSIGNTIGIRNTRNSKVSIIGIQPIGTTQFSQSYGGIFVNQNGTQISDDITAGLSCTWGTIRSGYVRHGNLNGAAMISINCRIDLTANLTANMPYTITGFPKPAISAFGTASVAVDSIAKTTLCSLERTGVITFVPSVNVTAGSWSFTFSVTYKTNS